MISKKFIKKTKKKGTLFWIEGFSGAGKTSISRGLSTEKERRRKMLDSIGRDAYNGVDLFAGTQPLRESKSTAPHGSKALDGIAPNDPGVNLSALGVNTAIWSKLAGN